jgi:hypothetical protein
MKTKNVDRIMKEVDAQLREFYKVTIDPRYRKKAYQLGWETSKIRKQFQTKLRYVPDDQVEELTASVSSFLYEGRKVMAQALKNLPRRPGGNPAKMTEVQKREACVQIGALTASGRTVREAQEEMARRYHVSRRTVQRAWAQRGSSTSPILERKESKR